MSAEQLMLLVIVCKFGAPILLTISLGMLRRREIERRYARRRPSVSYQPVRRPVRSDENGEGWLREMRRGLETWLSGEWIAAYREYRALREPTRAVRRAERDERRAERDAAYQARGITPGRLAWYRALPDVWQAIVAGLALALPFAIAVIIIFRSMAPVVEP